MNKKDEAWAIFWCSLLEPILFGDVEPEAVREHLRKIAGEERLFPDGTHRKPSLSTLRRKLRAYRSGGFEALARKRRRDQGEPRAHARERIERAVQIKRDQPLRSDRTINELLDSEHRKKIPRSTLYRHLRRAGATRAKLGVLGKKVRRRFTRDRPNELCIGDCAAVRSHHRPYNRQGPRRFPRRGPLPNFSLLPYAKSNGPKGLAEDSRESADLAPNPRLTHPWLRLERNHGFSIT